MKPAALHRVFGLEFETHSDISLHLSIQNGSEDVPDFFGAEKTPQRTPRPQRQFVQSSKRSI